MPVTKPWAALVPLLLVITPALMGMRGCDDSVPIGGTCEPDDCGPALGAPAITCADGSIGGNTGRCIDLGGQCGWELRECPDVAECPGASDGSWLTIDECTACGGTVVGDPGDGRTHRPDFRCSDGSPSLGSVSFGIEGGACCPRQPASCEPADCGPAPGTPSWICTDGTVGGFTGRCLRDPATATCGWEIIDCARGGECEVAECGPAPGAPTYTCPDGSIGGNTGRCLRAADGTCGWELRACPTEVACGGLTPEPVDCGEGHFCAWQVEHMCGAADHPGTCTLRPGASECAAIDGPEVCGCDGVTYENECFAWAAGQSAFRVGACEGTVRCDLGPVVCDAVPPACPAGQVPSVTPEGTCWTGECVTPDRCAPARDCRSSGCSLGQTCEVCLGEDGAVYTCIPEGAAC